MSHIHFILQGKGGVGKSLIAALMTQYQLHEGIPTIAVDTDPVNASLAAYSAFPTRRIELLDKHQNLKPREFDTLMEMIVAHPDEAFVIDNGASSFLPLSGYLVENDVMAMLQGMGRQVIVHTVVTGGQAMMDTLHGLAALGKNMQVPLAIWINGYFGEVVADGKRFEQMKVYESLKRQIVAVMRIDKMSPLFEDDFRTLLERHLTFEQALNDEGFNLMARNRLKMIRDNLFAQLGHLRAAIAMDGNHAEA